MLKCNKCSIKLIDLKKKLNAKTNVFFSANGGGSGGRIAIYLSEYMLFNGDLVATGGTANYPGGPGTVYVQSHVANNMHKELWIDNLGRGDENSCDYSTEIDNIDLDVIHVENRACAVPTKVSYKQKYPRDCTYSIVNSSRDTRLKILNKISVIELNSRKNKFDALLVGVC